MGSPPSPGGIDGGGDPDEENASGGIYFATIHGEAPRCIIIAGPNGAGKTTFAKKFLTVDEGILHFVNADLIASGLSPLHPELAARAAGRLLLAEVDRLTKGKEPFALESTLSGMAYVQRLRSIRKAGYLVEMVFLKLDSPKLAIKRVAHRVRQGGHNVPPGEVRRRYERGWINLVEYYRQLADVWAVYDNSGPVPVLLKASMSKAPQSKATDDFIISVTKALKRAAKEARRQAKIHGTKVWVMKDGKVVGLEP